MNHDLPLAFKLLDLVGFLRISGLPPADISRPESVAIASSESLPACTLISFFRLAICLRKKKTTSDYLLEKSSTNSLTSVSMHSLCFSRFCFSVLAR